MANSETDLIESIQKAPVGKKSETFVGGVYAPNYSAKSEWESNVGQALKDAAERVIEQRLPVSGNLAKGFC